MKEKELDRLGLRGPCPITDEDWVLMHAGSAVAAAAGSVAKDLKGKLPMDAMKRAESGEFYSLDHWAKSHNGVVEKRIWSNNYGEQFPEHIQKMLNEAYKAGFKDGQSNVRLAIRVAMGDAV